MGEEPLAGLVVEDAADELETAVRVAQSVAVGQIEHLII